MQSSGKDEYYYVYIYIAELFVNQHRASVLYILFSRISIALFYLGGVGKGRNDLIENENNSRKNEKKKKNELCTYGSMNIKQKKMLYIQARWAVQGFLIFYFRRLFLFRLGVLYLSELQSYR